MRAVEIFEDFNIDVTDSSDIFGNGSNLITYTDDRTNSFIKLVTGHGKIRDASIIELYVPEEFRGSGIGKRLLASAMKRYPSIMGQVSSKAAAVNAFKAGRRPYNKPDASINDIFNMIDQDSSVNLLTVED